jgi:hypothetical protein
MVVREAQLGHPDAEGLAHANPRFVVDVERRVVGVHPAHAAQSGQWVCAFRHQFGDAVLGEQIHHHEDVLGADRQIHRAANGGDVTRRTGVPIGQVRMLTHLKRAEDAHVG